MKDLWHAVCVGVYLSRFNLLALVLVVGIWVVVAEWLIPRSILDAIVYLCFGWLVLGKVCLPWMERKLEKLFN